MILSLVAVLLIGAVAWAGAAAGHLTLLGMALPLFAAAVFICGFVRRVVGWAKSPVPFAIPTTGGQEKSLSWIRPNRLDTPMSTAGVVGRMLLEVLLFRSLFRNTHVKVKVNFKNLSEAELELEVDVEPYWEVVLDPVFGLD